MSDSTINMLKGAISLKIADEGDSIGDYKILSVSVYYKANDSGKYSKIGTYPTGIGVDTFYKHRYEFLGDLMEILHGVLSKQTESNETVAALKEEAEAMSALSMIEDLPYHAKNLIKEKETSAA
ncbi:MAG: hypothetical protein ILA15_11675 [Clostridiales bacterium]|nr:hypothetical protein [Clostridiales bacterium]